MRAVQSVHPNLTESRSSAAGKSYLSLMTATAVISGIIRVIAKLETGRDRGVGALPTYL
jgi:hypothetical protein